MERFHSIEHVDLLSQVCWLVGWHRGKLCSTLPLLLVKTGGKVSVFLLDPLA